MPPRFMGGIISRGPICFKIKRPDYGSGQLERDLIFLQLKDRFNFGMRCRARVMPRKTAKIS